MVMVFKSKSGLVDWFGCSLEQAGWVRAGPTGLLRFVPFHPGDKKRNVVRVGHPGLVVSGSSRVGSASRNGKFAPILRDEVCFSGNTAAIEDNPIERPDCGEFSAAVFERGEEDFSGNVANERVLSEGAAAKAADG